MERAFNAARRACYAGLDSVTLRREITNRVGCAVQFDAYAFSTCDPDTAIMSHTVSEGVPAVLGRTYVEMLYPKVVVHSRSHSPRNPARVFSIADEHPVVGSVFRSHGIRDEVHVSVAGAGRLWGTWCLMRATRSATTAEKYFPFLERLAPHIARGLQSAALIDRALAERDTSPVENGPGVIILDSANRPTLRTGSATTWLADLRDVGMAMPDDVPLSVISLATRLRRSEGQNSEVHVRARGLSGRWYTLRASLSLPTASGDNSVVVVIRPAMPMEVGTILTQLYGFSAREREVIAAVARGESTKAIAACLGVSPHTVTEHIDRACEKLGVRGRKALIAKLFFDGYAPHLRHEKPTLSVAS